MISGRMGFLVWTVFLLWGRPQKREKQ